MKKPGHVLHITDDYSPNNPGVAAVVTQIAGYLAGQGWPTTVLAAGVATTQLPKGVDLKEFPLHPEGRKWRYPEGLAAYLSSLGRLPGKIFHLHGQWMASQWLAARAAKREGVPAVLTAHGQLEPWHWRDGRLRRLKKLAYWYLMAYPAFRHLPVIHAITLEERDHLAQHFPGQRLEVIPNALDLTEVDSILEDLGEEPAPGGEHPYLFFLGRLHPKKGVEVLLSAFAHTIRGKPFRLLIAGPADHPAYAARLQSQVLELGLEGQVTFLGPVFGPRKWRLYRDAWAFCAPSHSEVVGLVNLEAAAAGTPVITTHETGLWDWEEGGGLLVHPQVEELASALEQVYCWGDRERQDRGRGLRQLVERRYSFKVVGPQWLTLYDELTE